MIWPTLYIADGLTCQGYRRGAEIRREYRFGVGTIQGVAKKLNTHRRMVRQALASAIPPERKTPARSSPKLGPVREFIDGIVQNDREAPRKQRHTAHRIWVRIQQEHPEACVAEATVRRYVRRRKQELGVAARETFVPQSYDWGVEAQVDWYEAAVEFDEGRQTTHFFSMRSMARRGAFHTAYFHPTQQAFLEAHEQRLGQIRRTQTIRSWSVRRLLVARQLYLQAQILKIQFVGSLALHFSALLLTVALHP